MEGAEFMSFRVLWFVVAGFILGFATSTLWEWLYYRGKRRTQLVQAARSTFPATPPTPVRAEQEASRAEPQETWALSYRSPGVYLESEQPQLSPQVQPSAATEVTEEPSPLGFATPVDQTDVPDTVGTTIVPPSTLAAPRINPATLADLQSTVAQTPIAQPVNVKSVSPAAPVVGATDPAIVSFAPLAATPGTQPFVQPSKLVEDKITKGEEAKVPIAGPISSSTVAVGQHGEQTIEPATVARNSPEPYGFVPPARMLSTKAVAFTDHPDDLALIKGVGEAYKRRLYNAGIYTWRQVAESDIETLRRITRAKPNANIGGWPQQAQDLAEKYQRWETTFQGPLDDFTRIDGIGAITADILYKANLCTYEQVASASPEDLAKIVPAPTVGDEIDFAGWINAAARLANTKRRNQELFP